jgi:phosphoglycerate dehydrogenase-like enzyme
MKPIAVAASGDFLKPDGSAAYPGFDFTPFAHHPSIRFFYLDAGSRIEPEQIADVDVLILSGSQVTRDSFHGNRRLGLIAQFGAGFDHIDLEAATAHAVAVTNTPMGVRRPMAVAIMTLILALVTRLPARARLAREGREGWTQAAGLTGLGLTGMTLSSIGLGNIASDLFNVMRPLDMRFIAHDPFVDAGVARTLGVELVSRDDAFAQADILTVNCPLTHDTRRMADARHIGLMKPSAYFINTSRGATVDQAALIDALRNRRIAGAALDVFEEEPLPQTSPLLDLDNVIVTPHSLCWSNELYSGCGRDAVAAVMDFIAGRVPRSIVNRSVVDKPEWVARLTANRGSFGNVGRSERVLQSG